jgi:fatty acid desaturase
VAWTIAVVIVFPFLAAIRQLLEHRSEQAKPEVDYSVVSHGAVNRMFGSGLVASTFGGAGFNRHMLHHWEPQISCTRLGDLERFLRETPAANIVEQGTTSYGSTFLRLLGRGRVR